MGTVFVTVFVGGMLLVVFGAFVFGTPQANLRKNFAALGNLRGRTKQEIIDAVGNPNSVSQAGAGKTLLQWMKTGADGAYHISLIFDANGICEGITHEYGS
jgi:hypothetical protein